ncbi:SDR family NAD(P)-dependent oxidoreductase [Streptomyces roseolus]|uniref:SDR family NAD(P)-dependent oxidoreductase n=1 Tax=Streptomyces roseolus TaxID=67358 RepID=UPI0036322D32
MRTSTVLETREEDLGRVLAVNFKGVFHACQEAARSMLSSGTRGSIVTMAPGAMDTSSPGLLCYSVARRPSSSPPRRSRSRPGPHGIRVDAVAPAGSALP